MRRTRAVLPALCPTVERAFDLLGRKWAGLIIRELSDGPRFYRDLENNIRNVSARMLSERVKEFEAEGIVTRTVQSGSPIRVVYDLTEKGRALVPIMLGIESWARAWSED